MNDITMPVAIDNVHGFLDHNGTIWLKLHDVAIGLGFTEHSIKNGVEYTNIRWTRVRNLLRQINFPPQVAENINFTTMNNRQLKEAFVPEFIFYILAMKANNDVARAFQLKVAVEIIPAIRKHGVFFDQQRFEHDRLLTRNNYIPTHHSVKDHIKILADYAAQQTGWPRDYFDKFFPIYFGRQNVGLGIKHGTRPDQATPEQNVRLKDTDNITIDIIRKGVNAHQHYAIIWQDVLDALDDYCRRFGIGEQAIQDYIQHHHKKRIK